MLINEYLTYQTDIYINFIFSDAVFFPSEGRTHLKLAMHYYFSGLLAFSEHYKLSINR